MIENITSTFGEGAKENPEDNDSLGLTQEAYEAERKSLIDTELTIAANFDKAMTTLSAGALGLSFAFIKDIAPNPQNTNMLSVAYIGFGIALLSILVTFLTGQEAYRCQRDILDALHSRGNEKKSNAENIKNRWSGVTQTLNLVSIISFFIGTVSLGNFILTNIPH
jgi:hypothetical protein